MEQEKFLQSFIRTDWVLVCYLKLVGKEKREIQTCRNFLQHPVCHSLQMGVPKEAQIGYQWIWNCQPKQQAIQKNIRWTRVGNRVGIPERYCGMKPHLKHCPLLLGPVFGHCLRSRRLPTHILKATNSFSYRATFHKTVLVCLLWWVTESHHL